MRGVLCFFGRFTFRSEKTKNVLYRGFLLEAMIKMDEHGFRDVDKGMTMMPMTKIMMYSYKMLYRLCLYFLRCGFDFNRLLGTCKSVSSGSGILRVLLTVTHTEPTCNRPRANIFWCKSCQKNLVFSYVFLSLSCAGP